MAWLSNADQDRLPLSRLNTCRSDRSRLGFIPRFGTASRYEGGAGMAFFLLQVASNSSGTIPRARCLHTTHEAEEHAAASARRGPHYSSRAGILRLSSYCF